MTTISKRVLVCGGRDFGRTREEYNFIFYTLNRVFEERQWIHGDASDGYWLPDVHIISGEADGVDSVATDYAVVNWTGYSGYPANWDRDGKAAGPIRNQQMLVEGKPDLVIAFPGGRGTADMVRRAKAAGVEVIEIDYN